MRLGSATIGSGETLKARASTSTSTSITQRGSFPFERTPPVHGALVQVRRKCEREDDGDWRSGGDGNGQIMGVR
jgi:hypothetical protein